MLRSLHIKNYALIEELHMNFDAGFSVITGETGAGKSIILGAINLLLGQRADVKSIRRGEKKCVIEAVFDISKYNMKSYFKENELEYDDECILRREVQSSGKSRAFINDSPSSVSQIRELGEQLIDIHSQHQNLLLNKEGFQLNVLDIIAGNEQILSEYVQVYTEWKALEKSLKKLTDLAEQSKADEDYIRFQLEQFAEANLKVGEKELLIQESETLEHAEDIKSSLYKLTQIFESDEVGLLALLKEGLLELNNLQNIYPEAEELAQRMESAVIELKDIAQEIADKSENVVYNPERLQEVENRLNIIYSLEQKHRVQSVEELMALEEDFVTRLNDITSYDERIEELTNQCAVAFDKAKSKAAQLSNSRKIAAIKIEKDLSSRLLPLGMPNVRFQIEIKQRETLSVHGEDSVSFLFSANKNGVLQNITSVASGGEIARVMLSIKAMIAGAVKLPTIIFDEIDTGVSGEIADRMADMMVEMGGLDRQVISITHLPQIAAKGSSHFKVYKLDNEEETISNIKKLNKEERIEEIANMLSGATLTDAALSNAKSLLGYK
ncbi:DNA repair protein RecN [Bacteroides coprosuis DSM 18011]|uniref:DNA repair protein RecN n=1 Tax=Bacteroides coprosuis DSM 18011 TaxID=679937 RepID=F3ZUM0_9BACE|nr:DNA repair protein RecN [Bacteroides coprosuis]EGJ71185.1 DNA repair protein RecN [Bacteroides coprosuis DSM 18011]